MWARASSRPRGRLGSACAPAPAGSASAAATIAHAIPLRVAQTPEPPQSPDPTAAWKPPQRGNGRQRLRKYGRLELDMRSMRALLVAWAVQRLGVRAGTTAIRRLCRQGRDVDRSEHRGRPACPVPRAPPDHHPPGVKEQRASAGSSSTARGGLSTSSPVRGPQGAAVTGSVPSPGRPFFARGKLRAGPRTGRRQAPLEPSPGRAEDRDLQRPPPVLLRQRPQAR